MHKFLAEIIDHKKKLVSELKTQRIFSKKKDNSFLLQQSLNLGNNLKIIAEFKKASPSKGYINNKTDINLMINFYDKFADAVSVLTEEKYFRGSMEDLKTARTITKLPILAKDFYIDPVQVLYANMHGADTILIISRILDSAQIKDIFDTATGLGMDAIIEVHSEQDLEKTYSIIDPKIVGINVRDLDTFTMDYSMFEKLIPLIKKGTFIVAESGIKKPQDIEQYKDKAEAVLIGSSLMTSDNPELFLKELKECCK